MALVVFMESPPRRLAATDDGRMAANVQQRPDAQRVYMLASRGELAGTPEALQALQRDCDKSTVLVLPLVVSLCPPSR